MRVAIIIPALNEAACVGRTLSALRALDGGMEILVVDGGSTDDTVKIARDMNVPVVVGPRGRGAQMNYGASLVISDVLLFVHADTLLPANAYALITEALRDPGITGGCFRLGFDKTNTVLRFLAYCTRFRCRVFHYGDQAFFARTNYFRRSGGYREYPIMEDLDFWLRMVRTGEVALLDAAVVSSARRFRRFGSVRQQIRNGLLVLLFFLGVSPFTLSRLYRDAR